MHEEYMDKLISDIQQYLKEESRKRQRRRKILFAAVNRPVKRRSYKPRPMLTGLFTLFSASAIGSLTVAIVALGLVIGSPTDVNSMICLLAIGMCGIFFTAMLVSAWKRLVLLDQLEENSRLILASKQETNFLLGHLMKDIS